MSFDLQRLYELLPVVHRMRDLEIAERTDGLLDADEAATLKSLLANISSLTADEVQELVALQDKAQTGPLKALLSVIAEQVAVLEENLDQLYDDLFIETCAEWVVPYIGDLVGVRGIVPFPEAKFTRRAEVANAIKSRRRKGTASMLEQLARDVTRWDARVREAFQVLATTQFMNHLRPKNKSYPDLKFSTLAHINTPFDDVPRTVDVRNISTSSIPSQGFYNIPNVAIFLWRIRSYPISDAAAFQVDPQRWKFDPLGRDLQLYNRRELDMTIEGFAEPINVPDPIKRLLYARRPGTYDPKSFTLEVGGNEEDFVICDLSDLGSGWAHTAKTKHAIDPELGRIALTAPATDVRVSYRYGFSADMGGGEYTRAARGDDQSVEIIAVPDDFATVNDAMDEILDRWTNGGAFDRGIVEITTNDVYPVTLDVTIPDGKNIDIRAKTATRPVLELQGTTSIAGGEDSGFGLDGLLVHSDTSGVTIEVPRFTATGDANQLTDFAIVHCTVLPHIVIDGDDVALRVESSILTRVRITDDAEASFADSILDAGSQSDPAYEGIGAGEAGGPMKIEECTVIGTVHTRIMELASNTIFAATSSSAPPVHATQVQKGCVRFSYVPPGSRVPRRYKCQPQRAGVRPLFTSTQLGDAAYVQLARNCPVEIRTGADDQSEMGAFHDLMQPQREANLRTRLEEFLRFGLEAGIFYSS